jgi:hypothetical protein
LYDTQAVARLTPNITVDFAALRTNGSFLTQSGAVLARIPAIAHNVSAAVAAATEMSMARTAVVPTGTGTETPSRAGRLQIGWATRRDVLVILVLGMASSWACNLDPTVCFTDAGID